MYSYTLFIIPSLGISAIALDTYNKYRFLQKASLSLSLKIPTRSVLIDKYFQTIKAKDWKGLPPTLAVFPSFTVPILVKPQVHHEDDNVGDATDLRNKQQYPGFYEFYRIELPQKTYVRFQDAFQGTILKNALGSITSGRSINFSEIVAHKRKHIDSQGFTSFVYCAKYNASLIRLARNFVDDVENQLINEIKNQSQIENIRSDSFVYSPQKFVIQVNFEVNPGWWWSNFDASYKIIISFKKIGSQIRFTTSVGYWVEGGFSAIQNRIISALSSGKNQIEQDITSELNRVANDELSAVTLDSTVDILINYSGDLCLAIK